MNSGRYAMGSLMLLVGIGLLYLALTPKGQAMWTILTQGVGGSKTTTPQVNPKIGAPNATDQNSNQAANTPSTQAPAAGTTIVFPFYLSAGQAQSA